MEQLSKNRLIISLDETLSTNSELKLLQQKKLLPEGAIVKADYQTHGRGQAGNTWFSERGRNLLFSLLLYPNFIKAKKQFIISRIVALAIKKVLDQYMEGVSIKWPNDIYWNDKKIAGMLIENNLLGQQISSTIVGIGLNVNQDEFPLELLNPVSMKQITGIEYDRDELLTSFIREFFLLYGSLQQGNEAKIERKYMNQLYRRENYHWYEDKDGRFEGKIMDVLSTGHLVLETFVGNEERIYAFKEVSFIL